MLRARRFWFVTAAVTALISGFVALSACSNYSEGERCESGNGNDDCQDGLQCTPAAQLVGSNSDRCCPVDRSTATTPICAVPTNGIGSDASPPETGPATDGNTPVDSSKPDTSTEAGTDSSATDSSADADEGG